MVSNEKCFRLMILVLTFVLTLNFASSESRNDGGGGADHDPWRDANQPKIFVDYLRKPLSGEVERFIGNSSAVDNFKLLVRDENFLLIGATNAVYFLNAKDMTEVKDLTIVWHPEATDFELCLLKGKNKDECQNHIRIVAKLSPELLLVCGTHAYHPRCRHYGFKDGHYVQIKQFPGTGLTPFDPYHNSSYVVADGELYSATVSDFSGSDPLIYKEPLRTAQFDSKHLNTPDFVRSVSEGDYVFFFFREKAVEYINCGKSVYSRVARVCKSDRGGPQKYKSSWTSFLKSRLNCSLPGEYPFYFDHLQATSEVVEGDYGGQTNRLVYAVFTTPRNAIGGNAICAFRIRDIMDAFEGAFKEQVSTNSNWLPVPKIKEPSPRPGRCSLDSTTLTEASLSFVKSHSIMDEAVPAFFGGRPLFVKANLQRPSQFRELSVDPQVRTSDGRTTDVLFVGTTEGRILKIVNTADPTNSITSRPSLIEEIALFPSDVYIEKIFIVRVNEGARSGPGKKTHKKPKLIVLTKDQVVSVPVSRCPVAAQSCSVCVALQDPYCAWNKLESKCVDLYDYDEEEINSNSFLQNVISGSHDGCKTGRSTSESDVRFAGSRGVQLLMLRTDFVTSSSSVSHMSTASGKFDKANNNEDAENGEDSVQYKHSISGGETNSVNQGSGSNGFTLVPGLTPIDGSHYSAEELSMAVATSVVCALVVGFITGFLMARRCSCSRDTDNPYHVPYLNQSGYHGDEIYAKVDDMTYYPVNSMLVSMPTATNTTVGSSSSQFHLPNNLNNMSSSSSSSGPPPAPPPPPPPSGMPPSMMGANGGGGYTSSLLPNSKTLSVHHPKPSDFHNFTTVHRSQKIYL